MISVGCVVRSFRCTGLRYFAYFSLPSIKRGDLFQRAKVASGLEKVLDLYATQGYIDMMAIPDATPASDDTVALNIKMLEGPQYRLGKVEIVAKKELADELRLRWQMPDGAVFDRSYLAKYATANHRLLPRTFTLQDIQLVRDCPDALVQVRLLVDPALSALLPAARAVRCEKPQGSAQ
jgi:hypothetical protein